MKKVSKSQILAMKLSNLGLKPLTNWTTRSENRLKNQLRTIRLHYNLDGEELEKRLQVEHEEHQPDIDSQPRTVGELIAAYPCRFTPRWREGDYEIRVGLGKEVIAELKQKLVDLGLTPDDWPALVRHDELLTHLSKSAILKLPVTEVIQDQGRCVGLDYYFRCEEKELNGKTMKDFLSIEPVDKDMRARSATIMLRDGDRSQYLERRKHQLFAIRQKLVAKGFTTRDGAFFKWNPEQKSLAKAMDQLKEHNLSPADQLRFAKIAVAKRWVI